MSDGELTQESCEASLRENGPDGEYWKKVKFYWIGLGNKGVVRNQQFWLGAFRDPRGERKELMEEEERAALERLTDPLTIYRGVSDLSHALGMSWTDDPNVAALFAWKAFDPYGTASVLKATVPKRCVLAYFLERENEVVIDPTGIQHEEVPMSPEEMKRRADEALRRGNSESKLQQQRDLRE